MKTLNKIFGKYKSKKKILLGGLLGINEENLNIDFEKFSLIDKIKIFNLIIKYYDKEKNFIQISVNDLDIIYIGSFNIKKIEHITLSKDYFYISQINNYSSSIFIEDLKILRKYYDKKNN